MFGEKIIGKIMQLTNSRKKLKFVKLLLAKNRWKKLQGFKKSLSVEITWEKNPASYKPLGKNVGCWGKFEIVQCQGENFWLQEKF